MKYGAVIVTFNPNVIFLDLLYTLKNHNFEIVVVDNCSEDRCLLSDINVKLIENVTNVGIAAALNQGLRYISTMGVTWSYTFDQDSMPSSNMLKQIISYIYLFYEKKVASIAPRFVCSNHYLESTGYFYKDSVITSGNLINIEAYTKIGGFKSELFIDSVDFEFCLNLRKHGYNIIQVNDAILFHGLGDPKNITIFGKKIQLSIHSSLRRYYMFRNNIYVQKKYLNSFPLYCIKRNVVLFIEILQILFVERDKYTNFKMILKGFYHGVMGKYGKYGS